MSDGNQAPRSIPLAALGLPLAGKLVGANVVALSLVGAIWFVLDGAGPLVVATGIFAALAIHLVLVLIALRPLRDIESVASRVWQGDYGARVEQSVIADHGVLRVGTMLNTLLDGLVADRARMRALAADVIAVGERERAAIARELHDSTAQRLAALQLQVASAVRDCGDPALAARLESVRDAAESITEEVRLLSHAVHPRILEDLGLVAALRKLARESTHGTGIDVQVDVQGELRELPRSVGSVLYRVAQESVANATRHASATRIRITVGTAGAVVRLEVRDNGRGFDRTETRTHRSGMGLLSMEERLSLVDGSLDITTAVGAGTTICATVPFFAEHAGQSWSSR
jgi:signal transduction histidine kinase